LAWRPHLVLDHVGKAAVEAKLDVEVGEALGDRAPDPLARRVHERLVLRPVARSLDDRLFKIGGRRLRVRGVEGHRLDGEGVAVALHADRDLQEDHRLPPARRHLHDRLFKVAQLVVELVGRRGRAGRRHERLEQAVTARERGALGHAQVGVQAARDDQVLELAHAPLRLLAEDREALAGAR
jgi:hypothetical protein